MTKTLHRVALTRLAGEALRAEFLGWQCRIRQLAAREQGGRPSAGMCPRLCTLHGGRLAEPIVTLIVELAPEESTQQFRFEYLKTQDPPERYERTLRFLQASYFQQPTRFSDVLTALFARYSAVSSRLLAAERCVLEFEQYNQGYAVPCSVARLPIVHPSYQATYWHNRLFNPYLPEQIDVLSFAPDWAHASSFRRHAVNDRNTAVRICDTRDINRPTDDAETSET